MKAHEVVTRTTVYSSEVAADVSTTNEALRDVIVWADAHPVVWKIVMGTKSGPFGRNGYTYLGYARGTSPESALLRAEALKRALEEAPSFFRWRVEFTLAHYGEKGFRSGYFRQHDTANISRGCCVLYYTPETVDDVIDRFLGWCEESYKFSTKHVTIDDKVVRVVASVPALARLKGALHEQD
jgi:hypothetical protein